MSDEFLRSLGDEERAKRLKLAQNDLWYLATSILKYGWGSQKGKPKGLTERLHKPICLWLDVNRLHNYLGMWLPRFHHKTTLVVVMIIQRLLRDPDQAILYLTHKDEHAVAVVKEVGEHFLRNKELRHLRPEIMPAMNSKKFLVNDRFTLRRETYSRFPSLVGKGSQSDLTGLHGDGTFLDDIIGLGTLVDNALPKVQDWYENSVIPVIEDGWVVATGTRWHHLAVYEEWIRDPDWKTMVRACSEFEDGSPDWSLENPIHGPVEYREKMTKVLKRLQRQMKRNFGPQMMNDPNPPGMRIWDPLKCEHYESWRALGRPELITVLSDPAPHGVGSGKERQRGDDYSEHDAWAIAVVGYWRTGERVRRGLIDGLASREWSEDQGCAVAAQFMRKYGTPFVGHEDVATSGMWQSLQKKACARLGTYFSWIPFKTTRQGKKVRLPALASIAELEDFFIATECPQPYVDKFLEIMRGYPQVAHDDEADAASFCTDPAIDDLVPAAFIRSEEEAAEEEWEGFTETARARYTAQW